MHTIYTLDEHGKRIVSAVPIKLTEASALFNEPSCATGYRVRMSLAEYNAAPKTPQQAINRTRAEINAKMARLQQRLDAISEIEGGTHANV